MDNIPANTEAFAETSGQGETPPPQTAANADTTRRNLFGTRDLLAALPNEAHSMVAAPPVVTADDKPHKFDGKNFKKWQYKMLFYLTEIKYHKYLHEDEPVIPEGNRDAYVQSSLDTWRHADWLCRGHILKCLTEPLFDVYQPNPALKTAKDLWTALEQKYGKDTVGVQKFSVAKFLHYRMVDSRPLLEQLDELQVICHELEAEQMPLAEQFQVHAFIDKLPPSWETYKSHLKHKQKGMSLTTLMVKLQIEATNRLNNAGPSREHHVNVTEPK